MELFIATIGFIIGIILGLYCKSIALLFFILTISLIILIILKKEKILDKKKIFFSIILIISIIISNLYVSILEENYNTTYKNLSKIKEDTSVTGIIVSKIQEKEYKYVCTIKLENNIQLILNIKKGNLKNNKQEMNLKYGDKISFKGEYEKVSIQRNYGGFDYNQYLKTKKIYGIITTKISKIQVLKKKNTSLIDKIIFDIKTKIEENLEKILPQKENNLAVGILIGEKSNIDEEIIENFKTSNLSHILAISGAHISYIVLGITFLLNKLKIGKKTGSFITIFFLLFFMNLTGATPSIARSCIMTIYVISAVFVHKKSDILISITLSLLIILIDNPYSILDIGLQLSYGGTIGIIILNNILKNKNHKKNKEDKEDKNNKNNRIENKIYMLFNKIKNYLRDTIILTMSANLIIIPIVAINFNTISLTFLISNILASPIFGIIIISGFIVIILSFISIKISLIFSFIFKISLNLLIIIADFSAKLPMSKIYIPTPNIILVISYYIILFIFLYFQYIKNTNIDKYKKKDNKNNRDNNKIKKYLISIIIIIVIINFLFILINNISNDFIIYFIDVGQGDSTLIVTQEKKNILIDGGGSENYDIGQSVLLPYLLDRHILKIDYLVISHFDSDHVLGTIPILENLKVNNIIICKQEKKSENYEKVIEISKNKNIKIMEVVKGDNIQIDKNVKIEILWPVEKQIQENILNNNSVVFKLYYNNFSILFTGDIEKIAEEQLNNLYKDNLTLQSNVLKVAHHGSKSSTIQEFIDLVKPQISLIGVGSKNTFGHPNSEVIKRLQQVNSKVYRTDIYGEIKLKIDKNGRIKISTQINV